MTANKFTCYFKMAGIKDKVKESLESYHVMPLLDEVIYKGLWKLEFDYLLDERNDFATGS